MSSRRLAIEIDPEDKLGYLLKQLHHQLRNAIEARMRVHGIGLTFPHAVALFALLRQPDLSGAELARMAMVTPQSMHGILSRMEADGLVSRTPHPGHGRILRTRITAKGARLLARGSKVADAVMDEAQAGLDAGQRQQLQALMKHCLGNLQAMAGPDAAPTMPPPCTGEDPVR